MTIQSNTLESSGSSGDPETCKITANPAAQRMCLDTSVDQCCANQTLPADYQSNELCSDPNQCSCLGNQASRVGTGEELALRSSQLSNSAVLWNHDGAIGGSQNLPLECESYINYPISGEQQNMSYEQHYGLGQSFYSGYRSSSSPNHYEYSYTHSNNRKGFQDFQNNPSGSLVAETVREPNLFSNDSHSSVCCPETKFGGQRQQQRHRIESLQQTSQTTSQRLTNVASQNENCNGAVGEPRKQQTGSSGHSQSRLNANLSNKDNVQLIAPSQEAGQLSHALAVNSANSTGQQSQPTKGGEEAAIVSTKQRRYTAESACQRQVVNSPRVNLYTGSSNTDDSGNCASIGGNFESASNQSVGSNLQSIIVGGDEHRVGVFLDIGSKNRSRDDQTSDHRNSNGSLKSTTESEVVASAEELAVKSSRTTTTIAIADPPRDNCTDCKAGGASSFSSPVHQQFKLDLALNSHLVAQTSSSQPRSNELEATATTSQEPAANLDQIDSIYLFPYNSNGIGVNTNDQARQHPQPPVNHQWNSLDHSESNLPSRMQLASKGTIPLQNNAPLSTNYHEQRVSSGQHNGHVLYMHNMARVNGGGPLEINYYVGSRPAASTKSDRPTFGIHQGGVNEPRYDYNSGQQYQSFAPNRTGVERHDYSFSPYDLTIVQQSAMVPSQAGSFLANHQ